jgi:hypothetical protein
MSPESEKSRFATDLVKKLKALSVTSKLPSGPKMVIFLLAVLQKRGHLESGYMSYPPWSRLKMGL